MIFPLLALSLALNAQAEGKRYLVVLKNQDGFQSAQQAMLAQTPNVALWAQQVQNLKIPSVGVFTRLKQTMLKESLRHVKSVIVESNDPSDIRQLKMDPSVAAVEEEIFYPLPKIVFASGSPAAVPPALLKTFAHHPVSYGQFHATDGTPWGIEAVKAVDAWGEAHGGASARVLILDTGIDRDHPSLAGNFEKGQNFLDDSIQPYPYFDEVGHGTHVAGTIAGISDDAGFSGVAPSAHILAGRVCSHKGCSSLGIIRGLEWAIEEKVDVVSMSLGGPSSSLGERIAAAEAFKAGITLVAAAGNDGTAFISYPAALSQMIAVGAIDSKDARATFSQYGAGLSVVAPGVAVLSSVPQGSGRVSDVEFALPGATLAPVISSVFQGSADALTPTQGVVVYAGLGKDTDFQTLDAKGKIVLMSRGETKFSDKVQNAMKAGAIAVVIHNNAPGMIGGSLSTDGSTVSIPVFMIEQASGEAMRNAIAAHQTVQARMSVVATSYATMDGTSMATPHVSGVVALMKSVNHSLTPEQVRQILTQTAHPLGPNTNNEFGSGLVDAQAAVHQALSIVPSLHLTINP